MKVDIAPTVHVHRYYYSGDKEIQGPIINGGPTVVVAITPKLANACTSTWFCLPARRGLPTPNMA